MALTPFGAVMAPVLGIAAGLNAGSAIKSARDGDVQEAIGSTMMAAGSATVAVTQFTSGPLSSAVAGVGMLTTVAGLLLNTAAD